MENNSQRSGGPGRWWIVVVVFAASYGAGQGQSSYAL